MTARNVNQRHSESPFAFTLWSMLFALLGDYLVTLRTLVVGLEAYRGVREMKVCRQRWVWLHIVFV